MTSCASPRLIRPRLCAFAVFVERAGEQNDAVLARRALEQLARGEEVLGCENLGGRHQCGLVAVLHGHQHGLQSHDRLARSDVTLQEAAHGTGLTHVRHNLAKRAFLRGGWMERQHLADGLAYLVIRSKADARSLAHAAALELEAQFEEEQLFEDKASVGWSCRALQLRQ